MVKSVSLSTSLLLKKKSGLLCTGKLSFLISLVFVLAIAAPARAEDVAPPGFAGVVQSGAVFWEFNQDTDQPTNYYYIPELASPEFGFRYYSAFQWQEGGGINGDGSVTVVGEESVCEPIPDGTGANITVQVQITYQGTISEPWGMELWDSSAAWPGDYLGGTETGAFTNISESEIDLGGGWKHLTWTGTWLNFPGNATHFHELSFAGGGGLELDEVVVDMVIHDGAPPIGPGRGEIPKVEILGDPNWVDESDLSRPKIADSNRALIFTAHTEDNDSDMDITSVTYGGQPMTKVIDRNFATSNRIYVAAFILNEAGITAASGSTFNVTWAQYPSQTPAYSSVFLSGVGQTYPLGYRAGNGGTADNTIETVTLWTNYGDMVILAGTCDYGPGNYNVLSGFTKGIELSPGSADGVTGYKSATGADETPSIEHDGGDNPPPQVIIGFVVQTEGGTAPDTTPPTPTKATWASPPSAISYNAITMTANEATDASGVQYYFENETITDGSHDSGWQENRTYTDYGLSPETEYTYRVKTHDQCPHHNEGDWSDSASDTTPEAPIICPEGDLTGDCKVDWEDLKCLTDQWLVPDCTSIPQGCACADLDGHTLVDFNDFALLAEDWHKEAALIIINEFMASNGETIADPQGEFDDWIEIHNASGAAIDIGGMYLEDENNRWQIPDDRPAETTIPAYGYLLIWADNDDGDTPGLHASFALDKDGDEISLYATDGTTLIDTVEVKDQTRDISHGRFPDAVGPWYDMSEPTPLLPNTTGMATSPYFSHPGGTFTTNFSLGLTTKSPTATIYYTKNSDEPTDTVSGTNFEYTSPFTVNSTTWVRARAYEGGQTASRIVSRTYIKLAPDVAAFQTNLPIVLVYSHGGDVDEERDYQPVSMVFIDTDETTGIANITDSADFADLGGMHLRGNSSADFDKKQYKFEIWDENREDIDGYAGAIYMDRNVSLLGLPSESDWVLQGPWGDKTLMKNYQIFAWSRDIGHYSPRCIFVEAFIDRYNKGEIDWNGGTNPDTSDYRGIYVLMEKNKRDDNRVDIARLEDTGENDCGYLLVKDWGGEEGFDTDTYYDHLEFDDPKGYELTTAQKDWIENHFNEFEAALASGNFKTPAHADYYGNYIDIDSFVNYHILVELCKDVDGYVLSTLVYKDHGGKITMGPLWDLNGSMGASYFCSYDYEGWLYEFDEGTCVDQSGCGHHGECDEEHYPHDCAAFPEDNEQAYQWYWRLFTDSEFKLKYADNWFHFREIQFDATKMLNDIDFNANLLQTDVAAESAIDRNFTLWDILDEDIWPSLWAICHSPNTYQDFVDWLKTWLDARLTWMDGQIDADYGDYPPEIFLEGDPCDTGGHADVGDEVTMTSSGGTIYYTIDGSDPRDWGGGIHGDPYSPITLNKSVQIKARIKYGGGAYDWSALNEATFAVGPVAENLRITEIMYHPQDTGDPINDPNAEFIELKNKSGSTTINLNLVKFTDGIDFTFPDITLSPGDYIIAIRDPTAFALHHPGFSGNIAPGQYTGRLNNAGERVELQDAFGKIIHNFGFKDGWYHITDGNGFSLDIIDPTSSDPNKWEYSEGWQASSIIKGTPGADDTGHFAAPGDIVINEVMTHTDVPPEDWIELHNTTASPINIGGWFLSDNDNDFKKYQIGSSTSIPTNGYIVFTEDDHFGSAFALSELGETVYLSSGSGGELDGGFCAKEDFKAAENGVTFGRYTKSEASGYDVDFVAMSSPTYESENTAGPKVGPIVITEIMYHPATSGQLNNYAEYIELYNTSGGSVSLDGWQFIDETGGIEFYFPSGTSLGSGEYLLVVKNLVAFEDEFGPAPPTAIEYVEGRLSNAGEKLQISKPGDPEPDFIPYIRVDRVNYSDGRHPENFHELPADPWPTSPDGGGDSLHRKVAGNYGNDVSNWKTDAPTPGS